MEFPLTVVKGKEDGIVLHPVDLQDWLDAGYKIKEPIKEAK